MAPRLTSLLVLVLCLGQAILKQQGLLPRPSISVQLGPMMPWGRNMTILCRAEAGFETFRLENCSKSRCSIVKEEGTSSFKTEARFSLALNAGRYVCIYQKSSIWSPRSEIQELAVTGVDATQAPIPTASTVPSASPGHLYLLIAAGVCVGFLALLLLLLFCHLHRQRHNKHRPPSRKDQEQRPQERASLTGDSPGRTADQATADQPLQQGREQGASGPQEVTYAQLDHLAVTQRGPREESPQSTAESSTYAVLARHGPSPPGSCT